MIVGLLILSVLFGTFSGCAAYLAGFSGLESLVIYAVAGQVPFLVVPLISPLMGHDGGSEAALLHDA